MAGHTKFTNRQVRVVESFDHGNQRVTNLADAVAANDAVSLSQLQQALLGLRWKDPVRVITTGPVTLSGLQTIDGVTVMAGDRVLVAAQALASENGIYVVADGGWLRAADADGSSKLVSATVLVEEGDTWADSQWTCTNNAPIVVGQDSIVFARLSGAGQIDAGAGLTKVGNRIDVGAGAGIAVLADTVEVRLGGSTLAVDAGGLRIADSGVTEGQIAAAALDSSLQGGAGAKLGVRLDGDSLQITAAGLSVAEGGIMPAAIVLPEGFVLRGTADGTAVLVRDVVGEAATDSGDHTVFGLAYPPIPGTERVYLNGARQFAGVGLDYTLAGSVITFNGATDADPRVVVDYQSAS